MKKNRARFAYTITGYIFDEDDFTEEEKCNSIEKATELVETLKYDLQAGMVIDRVDISVSMIDE